ncbi:MAG TPA: glycosyltransferase [Planctomycetota bacterium]|nr:glycosyltransferase [Planctomycetota bacterium]
MRILILSHPVDTPSTRHRILPLIPLFQRDGIEVERVDVPSGLGKRWKLLGRVPDFDVVLHQKRLLPAWQFKALRRAAKKLVYDFDDPMVYSRKGGKVTLSETRAARFRSILSQADAVTCHVGSEALAREYGAAKVHTIPTSVELSRWPMKESWDAFKPTLGWLGSAGNLSNLKEIAPALQGRRLKIVADKSIALPGVEVEFAKWDAATEAAQVRSFDIALAPLPDDPWSRAKMPYKILNYWASGVPVVASALGAVTSVLRDGENGLLAGDWAAAIRRLEDASLRERLGRAGRRTVEADFTIESAYATLKSLLVSLTS